MNVNGFIRAAVVAVCVVCVTDTRGQIGITDYRKAVVEYSYALKVARQQSVAAAERSAAAKTGYLPKLSATGSFAIDFRQTKSYDGDVPKWVEPYTFALQPTVIQTIYGGGAVRSGYNRARVAYEIALCEEAFAELDILYAAEYAYWSHSASVKLYEATVRYVQIIRSLEEMVRQRFEEGYIGRGDVLMVEAQLSEAEYGLINAEKYLRTTRNNFNILMGASPEAEIVLADSVSQEIVMPERVVLDRILLDRPDYIASEKQVEYAEWGVSSAGSAYNPSLSLGVGGIWHNTTPNFGSTRLDGSVYLNLSIPIFGWGERRKTVGAARAELEASRYGLSGLRDDILREESNAWTGIVENFMQVNYSKRSLEIARQNLELSTLSYNEGQLAILDVLSAQLSWIQLYTNAITAEYNYRISLAQYRRATGTKD